MRILNSVALRAAQLLLAASALASCAGPGPIAPGAAPPEIPAEISRAMPPARQFAATRAAPPARSNTEIARDILDLTTRLENDVELPVFTRFDEPITIALTGDTTPVFDTELDRLIARIRAEAGIDLRRVADPATAAITVEAIGRDDLARTVPTAACFVLPRRITWEEFSGRRERAGLRWTELTRRDAASIFVPADISPQEIRDCLHEEIAQALGPVNDLYRLEDSIFNDDNMHSVLTGFDMLVLRTVYDPALANGMTREQVAARLPAILDRLNPGGARYATRPYAPTTTNWKRAMDGALTPSRSIAARRRDSRRALAIAEEAEWGGVRLGLSLLTTGRLSSGADSREALQAFLGAAEVYSERPATAIHAANVGIQVAAFALATGDLDAAIRICDSHIPAAREAQNAALLSDFLMVKAAALRAEGQDAQAARVWRDGSGWARYGLRSDGAVLRRAAEIAALAPQPKEGT